MRAQGIWKAKSPLTVPVAVTLIVVLTSGGCASGRWRGTSTASRGYAENPSRQGTTDEFDPWAAVMALERNIPLEVTLRTGERIRGGFISVTPQEFILLTEDGDRLGLAPPSVQRVAVRSGQGDWGALWGAAAGGATGAILVGTSDAEDAHAPLTIFWTLILAGVGAGIGALIGVFIPDRDIVYQNP